jgi:hypothetical protein
MCVHVIRAPLSLILRVSLLTPLTVSLVFFLLFLFPTCVRQIRFFFFFNRLGMMSSWYHCKSIKPLSAATVSLSSIDASLSQRHHRHGHQAPAAAAAAVIEVYSATLTVTAHLKGIRFYM